MKADMIAQQQMPPEAHAAISTIATTSATKASPVEAAQFNQQAGDILAQFSSPIMTDLMGQFAQQVATPPQEDPLVEIRKQELALKGQELSTRSRTV